jgi:ApbE superfamily uncharacterized protein (UPF0280 family)
MYEERFYRGISRPQDLLCYEVSVKETDLFCCTGTDLRPFIEERVLFYRNQLEGYIKAKPLFKESLLPADFDPFAPRIVKEMIRASSSLGVGPMATVAGAIAEFIGNDIAALTDEYIVENGGDIFLKTARDRVVLIYAKDSPYSERVGIRLKGRETPYGICTSSATVGPSLSLGKADAVCVVGDSALFADGLATYVGNIVKKKEDIRIAIEKGKAFPKVSGILIILGEQMGAWGDLEIIKV